MLAMRPAVVAWLVVGVAGSAHAQTAPSGSDAPLAPPSSVEPSPPPKQPTGTFGIGISYRSDDGATVHADVGQSDLFHTGTGLYMDASLSERVQHLSDRFVDPNLLGGRLSLSVEVFRDRRLLGDTGTWRDATGLDVSLSTRLADHTHAFVGYRIEEVDRTGDLGWLRAGADYSTLDHAMAPTRGTSVGVTIAEAAHELGSDDDLLRIDAWFNTHQPVGPFIFHTGGRFAAIAGLHDPSDVPLTEQLYFGASSDLRGFGFGDGPGAYSPGNVLGTWRTSLELPISHGISVHGFWDAAGIFDWSGRGTIAQSVGGGVLWRSPIGPISVDYAVPFVGEGPRLLLGIGQTFD
jgi:outer membrane protein insertion porin family